LLVVDEGGPVNPGNLPDFHQQALSVGVLVLNYNTWALALRSLDAAIGLEGENVSEYVLFDDGSTEPAPKGIDNRIRLIRGDSNRGFAHALVTAFGAIKSDIIVLFDSDACPLTPFSVRVRNQFELQPRLGQLGFMAQNSNGDPTESYLGEPNQWSLIFGQALYARLPKRPLRPSQLCVITGCMATRMEAYRQVGGFDKDFGFLDVDLDYSMRLRRRGWIVRTDSSIKVFHVGGGTPQLQRNRVLQFYKSRWRLLKKHGLMPSPRLARTLILARLACEEKFLRFFGRYLFKRPDVLEDKILGRKAIVSYCQTYYH
jgi:GT2 family glycosyltransferase